MYIREDNICSVIQNTIEPLSISRGCFSWEDRFKKKIQELFGNKNCEELSRYGIEWHRFMIYGINCMNVWFYNKETNQKCYAGSYCLGSLGIKQW